MKVPKVQKILIDSDAIISIRFSDQSTHLQAIKMLHRLQKHKAQLYCLNLDAILEQLTWDLFLKQSKKGTSFIDCANLTALSYYNFDKIFSFDQFYPKTLRLL